MKWQQSSVLWPCCLHLHSNSVMFRWMPKWTSGRSVYTGSVSIQERFKDCGQWQLQQQKREHLVLSQYELWDLSPFSGCVGHISCNLLHNQPASSFPVTTESIWTWFSNAEDGGSTFLQNTGVNLWSYTVPKSRSRSPWRRKQHVPLKHQYVLRTLSKFRRLSFQQHLFWKHKKLYLKTCYIIS